MSLLPRPGISRLDLRETEEQGDDDDGAFPQIWHVYCLDSAAGRNLGLVAQDVRTVVQSLVTEGDILTPNYAGLTVVAVGAIQDRHEQKTFESR